MPYDANGAIFWKGKYHLMYIFQDRTLPDGGHCWGHASSTDLVNWTFHPAALAPLPGDADKGTFSGNAFVNKEGKPMLCWFGTRRRRVRRHGRGRRPDPLEKTSQESDYRRSEARPTRLRRLQAVGSVPVAGRRYLLLHRRQHLLQRQSTPYLLKSPDLVNWDAAARFLRLSRSLGLQADEDCSCPDFFKLGNKRVLMCISHTVGARCYVGRYEKEKFYPEQHVRMNWPGSNFFAPESLLDDQGRRIFWAWVIDPRLRARRMPRARACRACRACCRWPMTARCGLRPPPELQFAAAQSADHRSHFACRPIRT